MTTYCPHCGFKNSYAGVKPKGCQSCSKPLEAIKVSVKTSRPARYEEPEEEFYIEEEFHMTIRTDAPRSLEPQFMKVTKEFALQGSFERGGDPYRDAKGQQEAKPAVQNPFVNQPAKKARKVRSAAAGAE